MSVRELFDSMAHRYDSAVESTRYFGPHWLRRTLPRVRQASRVVDLGCANGALGVIVRQHFPDGHLTGIDVSDRMIDEARARGDYDRLIVHDLNLPLMQIEDSTADLVIALGFCEFLEAPGLLLDEIVRMLAVDGELLISFQEHRPDHPSEAPRTTRSGSVLHHACTMAEVSEIMTARPLLVKSLDSETGYVSASGYPCPYILSHAVRQQR